LDIEGATIRVVSRNSGDEMKIKIQGDTPHERMTNITKGLLAVPKSDVVKAEKKRQAKKQRRKA
jgi:hypothetical protein